MFEGDLNGEKEMAMNMWRKGVPGRACTMALRQDCGCRVVSKGERGRGRGEQIVQGPVGCGQGLGFRLEGGGSLEG